MESMTSRADPPHQARVEGPQLPTRADLERATAVTAAAIAGVRGGWAVGWCSCASHERPPVLSVTGHSQTVNRWQRSCPA